MVDPSIDVINVLKNKLLDSYITEEHLINVHCMKGQSVILGSECKTIFIAGMGGKEIQEIIQNLIPQLGAKDRLVISPHRNILELRRYLHNSVLVLVDEVALEEDGQFYQILCLTKSPGFSKVPLFGGKIWSGPLGERYRQHQLQTFRQHQDELSRAYVAHLAQLSN